MRSSDRTILLVDDDISLLITLGDFLRFEGYRVETAESGEAALKKLESIRPHLIILDMSMPGMGGIGFLRTINPAQTKPRYPVLVLSARAATQDSASSLGVDGYVTKPCDPHHLLAEVGRILLLRNYTPEAFADRDGRQAHRVLIGDDRRETRERIAAGLAAAGYEVDSVQNGPEVLEKAILERPDVILLKLFLGNMQGDAVAGMVKNMPRTSGIPVVLYDGSGAQVPDTRFADPALGIRTFIRTEDVDTLKAAVRDVLGTCP